MVLWRIRSMKLATEIQMARNQWYLRAYTRTMATDTLWYFNVLMQSQVICYMFTSVCCNNHTKLCVRFVDSPSWNKCTLGASSISDFNVISGTKIGQDNKVHGANMGPTWVLSAPDGPRVGRLNLAIRVTITYYILWECIGWGRVCNIADTNAILQVWKY